VLRAGIVESVHFGDIAITDAHGNILHALGDPDRPTFYRSSAKPIQALNVVLSGAADRFDFTEAELAICCASHSGSAEHTLVAAGILAKIGLSEANLMCGAHEPGDAEERKRLAIEGREPSALHNNCSGKHSGMLAACVAMGADPATYLSLDHPVQQANLRNVAMFSGMDVVGIRVGEDGCGAPVFALPLHTIATSFARLVNPVDLRTDAARAAGRVARAMRAYPHLISSRGDFWERLMLWSAADPAAGNAADLTMKGGAEGLLCCGLPRLGVGIAIKVSDGSHRAQPPVLLEALRRLCGIDARSSADMAGYVAPTVLNVLGHEVGRIEPALPPGFIG
jgi:L-asparaginase II